MNIGWNQSIVSSCCVTLALLGLSGVSLEEEQLLAVKAMYDWTCLSTCPLAMARACATKRCHI